MSVAEVLARTDPDKVPPRLDGLTAWFLLFPVVHHLRHQDHHGDHEADPGADEDAAQGVESDALTVVQHWAVCPQGGVPEPEPEQRLEEQQRLPVRKSTCSSEIQNICPSEAPG